MDDEKDVTDLAQYHLEAKWLTASTINTPNHSLEAGRDT